jgi:hypothetical protein
VTEETVPYLVLGLTIKSAEAIIKNDNVLLCVYGSRKRLEGIRVSKSGSEGGVNGSTHYALALPPTQCDTLAPNLGLITLGQLT